MSKLWLTTLLMVTLVIGSHGGIANGGRQRIAPQNDYLPLSEINNHSLTALLTTGIFHDTEIFKKAKIFLDDLQGSPTCHRAAAEDLITTCRSPGQQGDDTHIQQLHSLYAARLAVCEHREAGAATPNDCSRLFMPIQLHFYSTDVASSRTSIAEAHGLPPCLAALEARTQSWTSYSNNRQQAGVICQAARAQVEKSELLTLHNNLMMMQQNISKALSDQVKQAAVWSDEQQQFLMSMHQLQESVFADMGYLAQEMIEHATLVGKNFESQLEQASNKVDAVFGTVANKSQLIIAVISNAMNEAATVQHKLDAMLRSVNEAQVESLQNKQQQLETTKQVSLEVQNGFRSLQEDWTNQMISMLQEMERAYLQAKAIGAIQSNTQEHFNAIEHGLAVQQRWIGQLQREYEVFAASQYEIQTSTIYQLDLIRQMTVEANSELADLRADIRRTARAFSVIERVAEPLRKLTVTLTYILILWIFWYLRAFSVILSNSCFSVFAGFLVLGSLTKQVLLEGRVSWFHTELFWKSEHQRAFLLPIAVVGSVISALVWIGVSWLIKLPVGHRRMLVRSSASAGNLEPDGVLPSVEVPFPSTRIPAIEDVATVFQETHEDNVRRVGGPTWALRGGRAHTCPL